MRNNNALHPTRFKVEGGVEAQAKQALKNLKVIVEAGGSELGKVVKTTVCSRIPPLVLVHPIPSSSSHPLGRAQYWNEHVFVAGILAKHG